MSCDLFIMEKNASIKTSEDVWSYMQNFTRYEEEINYNNLEGCSETIIAAAEKMFQKFPPMNLEYESSKEVSNDTENDEDYMTDYSMGEHAIFCSFAWSVAEEAFEYVLSLVDVYDVIILDPQEGDIYGRDIECLKYRTEALDDRSALWEDIELSIQSIDSFERGTSNRNNAFITVWFEKNGEDLDDYIQCSPNYTKKGFFQSLFRKNKTKIESYVFEIWKDGGLYQTNIRTKRDLIQYMKAWCIDRKEPNISTYEKIM